MATAPTVALPLLSQRTKKKERRLVAGSASTALLRMR